MTAPSSAWELMATHQDGTVFIGGHDGLFRWQASSRTLDHLLSGSRVLALAVPPAADTTAADERGLSPDRPRATGLTLLAGTEDDGILISRDAGRTWEGANPGLLDLTVLALAASPDFHDDGLAFAATPSGLFRTRNGAESWRIVDLDWDDAAVQCLAVSPAFGEDRVVLAGTEDHGLLRSDDAGRSWEQVHDLADLMINGLAFGPDGRVIAATDAGVARSDDAGETWRLTGEDLGGVAGAVACGRGSSGVLLAGLPESGAPNVPGLPHTGIARSTDDGQAWTAANTGLAARLAVGVTLSPSFADDATLYAATLDVGRLVSRDGGLSWTTHEDDAAPEATWGDLPPPPGSGQIVTMGAAPDADRQTNAPIYCATAGGAGAGAGASAGLVIWRTTDRGRRWDRWLDLPDVPGGSAVQVVALPPNRWGDAVVVGAGGQAHRPRPNAWAVSGGRRRPVWDAINVAAADAAGRLASVTGLAASPEYAADRTLFASTSDGVYVSRDGGLSFESWSEGLAPRATVAVAPSPAYATDRLVYALGLGGTVWRRRDP
jgi:hypothetical protein